MPKQIKDLTPFYRYKASLLEMLEKYEKTTQQFYEDFSKEKDKKYMHMCCGQLQAISDIKYILTHK